MSHILVLNGSARPNAFTAVMIRSFCKGAESVGHTVTVIDLWCACACYERYNRAS